MSKKLKNYLAEASEKELTYNHRDVVKIAKENINKAVKLLKKNPEFVEELNNISDHEEGIKQFLKSEQQRDLVASAYILMRNKDEAPREEVGLDVQNAKQFRTYAKKVVDDTRHTANALGKDTPSIEETKRLRDADFDPDVIEQMKAAASEEPETQEEPEEPEGEGPEETPEEPEEEEQPEEQPDEEEPEEDEEEEAEEQPAQEKQKTQDKTGSDLVDTSRFPEPVETAEKIQKIYKDTEEKVQEFKKEIGDSPQKGELRKIDDTANKYLKQINKHINTARKAQTGWENFPTKKSAMNASTRALNAQSQAQRAADYLIHLIRKKLAPGVVKTTKDDIASAGRAVGKAAKSFAGSSAVQRAKQAIGRFGKQAAQAGKRAADMGKEEIAVIRQKLAAKDIAENMGKEKANEFIELLKQNKTEEANKIAQEARRIASEANRVSRLEKFQKEKLGESNRALSQFKHIRI